MLEGWLQIALFIAVLIALTPVVGGYMARVYTGEATFLAPVERLAYRVMRVDVTRRQDWKDYARSLLVLSGLFWLSLYLILRTQAHAVPADLSFNTASSFVTNTN